jgi:uncharacterized membrane protein YoaK (UPF0700 family)
MNLTLLLSPESGLIVAGIYLTVMFLKKQIELAFPLLRENRIWKRVILPWLSVLAGVAIGHFLGSPVVVCIILGCFTSLFHSSIKALLSKSELLNLKDSINPKENKEGGVE